MRLRNFSGHKTYGKGRGLEKERVQGFEDSRGQKSEGFKDSRIQGVEWKRQKVGGLETEDRRQETGDRRQEKVGGLEG